MSVVNISETSTPEELKSQINTVQSTTGFHQITIDEYLLAKEEIKFRLENIANDFIAIGFRLRQINDSEAYRQEGYTSISEFAKKEYKIEDYTTSRLMAINEHFSVGGYSDKLKPEYKNYGTSLLYEMTRLKEEDRQLITAGTTVASIRELKRFNREADEKEENKNNNTETPEQPAVKETEEKAAEQPEVDKQEHNGTEANKTSCKESEQEETEYNTTEVVTAEILSAGSATYSDLEKVIIEFFRNERELLNEIYQMSDYESIADRINPSGSRTFRKKIYMLFMYGYGEGLILKKMGEENTSYTWQQFIEATVGIYKATYTDHDTVWENFYQSEQEAEQTETGIKEAADIKASDKEKHTPEPATDTQDIKEKDNKEEKTEGTTDSRTDEHRDNVENAKPVAAKTISNETTGSSETLATSQENSILSLRRWYMSNKQMSLDMGVKQEIADRLCISITPETLEKISEFIEDLVVEYTAYVYKNMGGEI